MKHEGPHSFTIFSLKKKKKSVLILLLVARKSHIAWSVHHWSKYHYCKHIACT